MNKDQTLTPLPIKRKKGEPATMNFVDALKKIIEGKKVFRVSWGNTDYGSLNNGWLSIFHLKEGELKAKNHIWNVSEADMEAEDWVVLTEEN